MAYARQRDLRAPPSGGGIIDAMEDVDWQCLSTEDQEDEVFASNQGSDEDTRFDSIVGALEEAVMDPTFASLQQSFIDEWCGEFDDVEENKLIYTDLFQRYTQLVERHLDGWLRQRIPAFDMEAFMKTVAEREDEIVGDVFDMIMAAGDFDEFKSTMLAHRKGRDHGLVGATATGVGSQGHGREGFIAPTEGFRARHAGVTAGEAGASPQGEAEFSSEGKRGARTGTGESKW